MSTSGPPFRRPWAFLAVTLVFGVSYTQLPLYTSNQTHHFLAGLARSGHGWLSLDWQVRTADPFPVFTLLVAFVHGYLGDWWFYVAYQALIGAYIWSLLGILAHVVPGCRGPRAQLLALVALTAVHSEVLGYLIGFDTTRMPWWQMFTWGVAEQEIFGHAMFQGSAFGMLLPLSILLFLRGRAWAAVTVAALVVCVHPGYGLTAGAITLGYLAWLAAGGEQPSRLVGLAAWSGLLVLPVIADVAVRFGPTSRDAWIAANTILARHLPRETWPFYWFPLKAWLQVGLIVAGLWRARRTALFPVMLVPFLAGVVLTLVQWMTGSVALALTFPWRVSVLLVPLATTLLIGGAASRLAARLDTVSAPRQLVAKGLAIVALAGLAVGGVVKMTLHAGYFYGMSPVMQAAGRIVPEDRLREFSQVLETDALGMLRFVRDSRRPGQVYLIPLDLERFRIDTGAPAFVDLKSHPYRDVEVLEWSRRVDLARRVLAPRPDCDTLANLGYRGVVTHVVAPRGAPVTSCPGLTGLYADAFFEVLRLTVPVMAATRGNGWRVQPGAPFRR